MNVLSLFDGMSCGQIALNRIGKKPSNYYAAEIKPSAINVAKANFPDTIHIGDVTKVTYADGVLSTEVGDYHVGSIDLLIGGSPCQDFSIARVSAGNNITGLEGDRSALFYEFLRIMKEVKPRYFLLENVKMKKESKAQLDEYLGVTGRFINSEVVSIQSRPRFYWTNIEFDDIEPKEANFQDVKDTDFGYCDQFKVKPTPSRLRMWNDGKGRTDLKSCANITDSDKIGCLTRKQDRAPNSGLIKHGDFCRYLTRREMEIAQTVPVGYTDCLTYNQAQDVLGDGWTVDVIAHILSKMDINYDTEAHNMLVEAKIALGMKDIDRAVDMIDLAMDAIAKYEEEIC